MKSTVRVIEPNSIHNILYYLVGILFLFLNKIRRSMQGYTSPRTFPISQFQKAIEYDFRVADELTLRLNEYSGINSGLKGKTILELGPGADLGLGIITLMKGVKKYNAIDVNKLVQSVPQQFYRKLFSYIKGIKDKEVDLDFLRSQLKLTQLGKNDRINYLCRKNFDLSVFEKESIDLVFSRAAFEHFANVEKAISQLTKAVVPGAILIAEIDLQAHTRWLRNADPLNIYKYSDFVYNLFKFSGSPNRLRPFEYEEILEKNGWSNIQILPLTVLAEDYILKVRSALNQRFQDQINQMSYLSLVLCATKK